MRVLVVEDDALMAIDLADQLEEAGFDILGPAMNVTEALEILSAIDCDTAVLDINLGQETSEEVARQLTLRGVPFIALSGYSNDQYPAAFKDAPSLVKPVRIELLKAELRRIQNNISPTV